MFFLFSSRRYCRENKSVFTITVAQRILIMQILTTHRVGEGVKSAYAGVMDRMQCGYI